MPTGAPPADLPRLFQQLSHGGLSDADDAAKGDDSVPDRTSRQAPSWPKRAGSHALGSFASDVSMKPIDDVVSDSPMNRAYSGQGVAVRLLQTAALTHGLDTMAARLCSTACADRRCRVTRIADGTAISLST